MVGADLCVCPGFSPKPPDRIPLNGTLSPVCEVPACAGTTERGTARLLPSICPHPPSERLNMSPLPWWQRVRVRGKWSPTSYHPHPNLPPSRGKGLVQRFLRFKGRVVNPPKLQNVAHQPVIAQHAGARDYPHVAPELYEPLLRSNSASNSRMRASAASARDCSTSARASASKRAARSFSSTSVVLPVSGSSTSKPRSSSQ